MPRNQRTCFGSLAMMVVLALLTVAPLHAGTITLYSSTSSVGAVDNSASDLTNGTIAGLTFSSSSLTGYSGGSWISVTNAPAGTQAIALSGDAPGGQQNGGFVEETFWLPSDFSSASIAGQFSVDELGYIFLNGSLIGQAGSTNGGLGTTVNSPNDASFGDLAYFQSGWNTLVFSNINANGDSGVEFYADVNYSQTPEPGTWMLLGTGLLGLAFVATRKSEPSGLPTLF
jgi:hypothetical protein